MESVRLKINEHMTSVGEDILYVLDKQQRGTDVCSVKLDVRVFVLERLSEVAQFLCDLFQREMEALTLLEEQNKPLDTDFDMDDLHTAGIYVCYTHQAAGYIDTKHQTTHCRFHTMHWRGVVRLQ